jgi:hypothetical protein
MKEFVKKLMDRFATRDPVWKLLNATVIPAAQYAQQRRNAAERAPIIEDAIQSIIPDMTIRNGVFAGMKYPQMKSAGSTMFPKLIGSYERELEPVLERICSQRYTEIVDIGCAEGYYAVGLAMRQEKAKIYAFDTDPDAIQLCCDMAALNAVSDRLVTGTFCDTATLTSLPLTDKALIISDCEGYEKQLFTTDAARQLAKHDLLIEVHDLLDISISSHLTNVFEATHRIERYSSIDDLQKAVTYNYPELNHLDLTTRKILFAEKRSSGMEWFFITPKNSEQ